MENTRAKPDCSTCWKAPECWLAQPGTFCTKYQSKEPERDSADNPAQKWSHGDELE